MSDKKRQNRFEIAPDGQVNITLFLFEEGDDGSFSRALGAMEIFKDNIKSWAQQRMMAMKLRAAQNGIIKPGANGLN